jgi:hypothetical protein
VCATRQCRALARHCALCLTPAVAIFTALCGFGTPGVASASGAPAAALQVTLMPTEGEPIPALAISVEEVEDGTTEQGDKEEAGMLVAKLLELVKIAPQRLERITVAAKVNEEGRGVLGQTAIDGLLLDGKAYFPAFSLTQSGSGRISFFVPPKVPGEPIRDRETPGVESSPLYVTLNISGGLLSVIPPTVSPAAPQVGAPVSFTRPEAEYPYAGTVTDRRYSWSFDDGGVSEEPGPTHTFESAGPHTVTVSVTAELHDKGREIPVSGDASVYVPVGTAAAQSPPGGAGQEGGAGGASPEAGAGNSGLGGTSTGRGSVSRGSATPRHGKTRAHPLGTRRTGAAESSDKLSLSFAAGSGGSAHGSGTPRADRAPERAGATNSGRAAAKHQQSARPTGAPPLTGVLLEADAGRLPSAILAGDALLSQNQPATLPAAAGSDGDGGPVGVLGWVAGILVVVIVVCIGGLVELWPGVSYRRLIAR